MTTRRLPTIGYPSTTQQYVLDGVVFTLAFQWSQRGECWYMDLLTVDGTPILVGRKLVTGFPLLCRVAAENRPRGELVLLDTMGQAARPTLEGFGTRFVLYYQEAA